MGENQKLQGGKFDSEKFMAVIDNFIQWLQQERNRQVWLCQILKDCTQ